MDRRSFLSWVGVGWVASCLPVAIVACTSDQPNSTQSPQSPSNSGDAGAKGSGDIRVGSVSELDKTGQLLNGKTAIGTVLVARNPADPKALIAVNPKCTHAGCQVAWKSEQKVFACPCHFANFGPDGKPISGPAKTPLSTYQARIEGDAVVVKRG